MNGGADGWDDSASGREFDFTQPLSSQLDAVRRAAPHLAISAIENENCNYCAGVAV